MSFYEASIYTPPASRQGIHRGWLEERRRERERERDGGYRERRKWKIRGEKGDGHSKRKEQGR